MPRHERALGTSYTSVRAPLALLWSDERRVRAIAVAALAIAVGYLVWRATSSLLGAPIWLSIPLFAVELLAVCQLGLTARSSWRLPSAEPGPSDARAFVLVLAERASDEELARTLLGVGRMHGVTGHRVVGEGGLRTAIAASPEEYVVVIGAGQIPRPDLIARAAAHCGPDIGAVALRSELANPDALEWAVTGFDERAVEVEVENPGRGVRRQAILPSSGFLARRSALDDASGAEPGLSQTTALWRAGWGTAHCGAPTVAELGSETLAEYLDRARRRVRQARRAVPLVLGPGLTAGQRASLAGAIAPRFSGVRWAVVIGVLVASLVTGRLPMDAPAWQVAIAAATAFAALGAGYVALGRGRAAAGDRMRHGLRTIGASLRALAGPARTGPRRASGGRTSGSLVAVLLLLDTALLARGLSAFADLGLPAFGSRGDGVIVVVATLFTTVVALDVLQLLVRRRHSRRHYRAVESRPAALDGTPATCVDMTPAGLRIEVSANRAPSVGDEVRVELALAEADAPLTLRGVARNRVEAGVRVRVGVELDRDSRPKELEAHYWLAPRASLAALPAEPRTAAPGGARRHATRAALRGVTAAAAGVAIAALFVPAAVGVGGLPTGALTQLTGSAACVADSIDACPAGRGLRDMQDIAVSPDGRSLYTTAFSGNVVGGFAIDPATGALSQAAGAAGCVSETGSDGCLNGKGLSGVRGIAISPDGKSVYIGATNGDSVAVLDRSLTTGVLTQSSGTDGCVSNSGSGGACATGRGLNGPGTPAVSPDGKNVYVPGDLSDALAVFARDPGTGDLTQPSGTAGCVSQSGSDGCADGDGIAEPRSVVVSPDGENVYAASQQGAVAAFARDATTGALTQLPGSAACVHDSGAGACADGRALGGARWVLISPDGSRVYVVTTSGNGIATFARNASTGALSQLPGTSGCVASSGSEGCLVAPHTAKGRGGTVSPDGETLYGAFQNSNAVAVLGRVSGGGLSPLATPQGCVHNSGSAPCSDGLAIGGPTDVAVSPDGRWAYVAARGSHSMGVFRRELAPTCEDRSASTSGGNATSVGLSCSDGHGDPVSYQLVSTPSNGTVTGFNPSTGTLTYVPDPGFSGTDAWSYRATDGTNLSTSALVSVDVAATPPPGPPAPPAPGPSPDPPGGSGGGGSGGAAGGSPPSTAGGAPPAAGDLPASSARIPKTLPARYDAKRDAFLIRVRLKIVRRGLCRRPCASSALISERVRRRSARPGRGRDSAAKRDPWRARASLGRARKLRLRGRRVQRFEVPVRRRVIGARATRKGGHLVLPVRMVVTLRTRDGRARFRKDSLIRISVRRYAAAGALAARRPLARSARRASG